jgi:hypothetical protein
MATSTTTTASNQQQAAAISGQGWMLCARFQDVQGGVYLALRERPAESIRLVALPDADCNERRSRSGKAPGDGGIAAARRYP